MISDKDIKALRGFTDTQYKLVRIFIFLLILFYLFMTYSNISLAIAYGESMGLNFEGVLEIWIAEPELQKQYLGYEVQSLHRLNMAILNIGTLVIFGAAYLTMGITRARNKNVLDALEDCGAIKKRENA